MDELIVQGEISSKILTLRGQQVMLDRDLAALYGVKPIRLREQVKRNQDRFPEDFMFQLTQKEVDFMVSQNAIPSKQHLGGAMPYVFTEQGVYMLASILKSPKAIEVNIWSLNQHGTTLDKLIKLCIKNTRWEIHNFFRECSIVFIMLTPK